MDKTVILDRLLDVFKDSLEITGWVILMMTLIELINVSSSGRLLAKVRNRPFLQILLAALLGAIPGCAGGFAVVSMFTHDLISFGALISGMVATFGDEAFFLFVQNPRWGAILTAILFGIAILSGLLFMLISKRWKFTLEPHNFDIHEEVDGHEPATSDVHKNGFKNRVLHFLKEHFWHHVVKHHLLKVFLWSFGVLLLLMLVGLFVDVEQLLQAKQWARYAMLLAAVLVGLIPESGPNLIFIAMFLNGTIPFGILLANSISQNGHAGLPLLAQSRRNFFIVKTITLALGFLVGMLAICV
ncbi:MAG: arsenic efflux protein [Bacteroidales bacterium]|nr:arsenic efflux protein [Bacteroidales bacterium]